MLLLNKTFEINTLLTRSSIARWILAAVFLASTTMTCLIERDNWPLLLLPFIIAFTVYALALSKRSVGSDIRFWLFTGILARVVLLFTFPNLSDDIYRFFWDGHSNLLGLSTYSMIPSVFLHESGETGALTYDLLTLMNSPRYHTVYPPPLQFIFSVGALISSGLYTFSISLKVIILLAELGTILLLKQFFNRTGHPERTLIYALNPLIIIELVGNVHFEAIMIFGLVLAITLLASPVKQLYKRYIGLAGGLFLAIGSKLLPLIALPFLLRRTSLKHFILICGSVLAAVSLSFTPLFTGKSISGMISSLGLYFQTFEFNASFYYIFRWIGFQWKGYNMIETIGPLCASLTIIILGCILLFERKPNKGNWAVPLLFAFTMYLFLSSIVHPWYVCTLVALGAFTKYRFALVWSCLVFLSYATYRTDSYVENYWLTAFEYIVVMGAMVYEVYHGRRVLAHG